jgi:hypothetical protein
MKKSILILGITSLISLVSFSQNTNKSNASIKADEAKKMSVTETKYLKSLGLSDEKVMDAQKIINALNERSAAVNASPKLTEAEKQKFQTEFEIKRSSALKEIMGEENYKKYQIHISKGKN